MGRRDRPGNVEHDARWKRLLLALCTLTALWILAFAVDTIGFRGPPWYGSWDAGNAPGPPYSYIFVDVQPGGAAAAAGIRDGDVIDLREQSQEERTRLASGAGMTMQPEILVTRRGSSPFTRRLTGSTVFEGNARSKLAAFIPLLVGSVWFLGIAFVVAARRAWLREARWLTLILLCWAAPPANVFAFPSAALSLAFSVAGDIAAWLTLLLLVGFAATFGRRTGLRQVLEAAAYAMIGFIAAYHFLIRYGLLTAQFDVSRWPQLPTFALAAALVVVLSMLAVLNTPRSERARASWLLLPIPIVFLLGQTLSLASAFFFPWSASAGLYAFGLGQIASIIGAFAVTYALLKRRVLDFEFVLSRTLVLATISLIVVVAFVLLEWLLGSVLAGVSHATGLAANILLALVLGVSLRYMHKRVDTFVDATFFRKRRDDERALQDFSREAAFVTDAKTLLEKAIEKLQQHTDARSATLFLKDTESYTSARSYGTASPATISENDNAILALLASHKALDPHRYDTALHGALAVPMLVRGRLLGVLLLGERAGGEAYAPDELEALTQFGHGIGSALEALSGGSADGKSAFEQMVIDRLASLSDAIQSLQTSNEAILRNSAAENRYIERGEATR
jgi:hypothetical protein